ncbi:MAG: hypothetical protein OEZ20_00905 [candidate division WOR-3 bacterium]|nr:hypothetical protein [candidate division WOR-3 bacterium]MDH5683019.1 hypothetical protein [candidate division WOR-3 bacterium]
MKKFNIAPRLILLFVLICPGLAQERFEPTPSFSVTDFSNSQLYVDDGEGMIQSYSEANTIITNKFFGLKERLNSRRWHGYQGNRRLSEPAFFELAGFGYEAKMAKRYQTIRNSVGWTGAGMIFLGLLIGVTQTKKDEEGKWHIPVFGIGLTATGIVLDALWYFAPPNYNQLRTALAAVSTYNQRK